MILSRLVLNPRSREVRRDLADVQEMHRTVMSLLPPTSSDASRGELGALFRVDSDLRGNPVLLVQSRVQPEWARLEQEYLGAAGNDRNPDSKDLSSVWRALKRGMTLSFRLRANPTRKIQTKTGPNGIKRNGMRVELRTQNDRMKWLQRKGANGGFDLMSMDTAGEIPNLSVVTEGKFSGVRWDPHAERIRSKLVFAAVLFEGQLIVVDPDRFRMTLERGIGSAKAFGFGLLSIAPPSIVKEPNADLSTYN